MSELKADNTFVFGEECLAYKKSEADKVIAELEEKHKTEVKELLCLIRDKENNFNRAFDSEEKEIRHHKYKRCLAMARWCNERHTFNETNEKRTWLHKWHNRWLELAEKFKTNSTAQQGKEEVK